MKELKETFRKNGLPYTLLKRNDVVALYGVGGTFTDKILHYEVCKIVFNEAGDRFDQHFEAFESIPGNELFGRDGSAKDRTTSLAILNRKEAFTYFDELTTSLNLPVEGINRGYVDDETQKEYNIPTQGANQLVEEVS